jgi:hypothetical protein
VGEIGLGEWFDMRALLVDGVFVQFQTEDRAVENLGAATHHRIWKCAAVRTRLSD